MVNDEALAPEPSEVVTLIGPEVATAGTVARAGAGTLGRRLASLVRRAASPEAVEEPAALRCGQQRP